MADATTTTDEDLSKASVKKEGFPGRSRLGSKGDHVKKLQAVLGVEQDGFFGHDTRKALEAAQEKKKLKPTGVFDPETWEAIS